MLTECGYSRAFTKDGAEYSFAPSFVRIASLGHPREIVQVFVDLFGPRAGEAATFVLASLCEQENVLELIGWSEPGTGEAAAPVWHAGQMPVVEQILLAQHLMRHGLCGKSTPDEGGGKYSATFEVAEYVAAARVHLGMSQADAEALSMSEFHMLMAVKFPPAKDDVPDADEYEATMALLKGASSG